MKGIKIHFAEYFAYPEGIASVEEFAAYLNENFHSFIKLKEYLTDNCCAPFFLKTNGSGNI